MFQNFLTRLKQPSTIAGIASAIVTLVTGGLSSAPAALSTLLVAFGLIVTNA